MGFDSRKAHFLDEAQARVELEYGAIGERGVLVLPGGAVELETQVGEGLRDLTMTVAIGPDPVEMLFPDVERRYTKTAQEPFIGAAAEKIDPFLVEVGWESTEGLDRVGVKEGSSGVGQIGETCATPKIKTTSGRPCLNKCK